MVKMVKVFYGEKGMGKTKMLVDMANKYVDTGKGSVVFIDDSNDLMYKLKHTMRFTNISDYPIKGAAPFFAFICGIVSQDFDIEAVFIDGLTYIVKESINGLEWFFEALDKLAAQFDIHFFLSINGTQSDMPEYLKVFIHDQR